MKKIFVLFLFLIAIPVAHAQALSLDEVRSGGRFSRMLSREMAPQVLGESVAASYKTTAAVNVRANPSVGIIGTIVGKQPAGMVGTVEQGTSIVAANGYNWIKLKFYSGVSGWVAMNNLILINTPVKFSSNTLQDQGIKSLKLIPVDLKLAYNTYTELKNANTKSIYFKDLLTTQRGRLAARLPWTYVLCFAPDYESGSWLDAGEGWIDTSDSGWVNAYGGLWENMEGDNDLHCFEWTPGEL